MDGYGPADYAQKCDWEGGFPAAFFGHGMPPYIVGAPAEVNDALERIEAVRKDIDLVQEYLSLNP